MEAPDEELARKLVRSLRYATQVAPDQLVAILSRLQPPCESAQWDETHAWLLQYQPDAQLVARLAGRYEDPAAHLIALLNEVAPPGVDWKGAEDDDDADHAHRRTYRLLFEIGTRESLAWALSRLDLFDYEQVRDFEELIGRRSAMIQAVALELWPTLAWGGRADIVLLLGTYQLLDHRFMELLLNVDIATMPSADRADYFEALGNSFDQRLLPRIQALLERALDDLSRQGTAHDKRAVAMATWEYQKLDADPPTAIRERVEALGVRWGEIPRERNLHHND